MGIRSNLGPARVITKGGWAGDRGGPVSALATLASVGAALTLLTACGGSDEKSGNSEISATTAATTIAAQTYPEVGALASAISSDVGGCRDFKRNPYRSDGTLGDCTISADGTSVKLALSIYQGNDKFTGAEQQQRGTALRGLDHTNTSYYLDGPEWTVECGTFPDVPTASLAACKEIQASLGGTLTTVEGSPVN